MTKIKRRIELLFARLLSSAATKIHLVMPVVTRCITVSDEDGNILSEHKSLAKSWTRNAYNVLFSNLGFANDQNGVISSTVFGDGILSAKNASGTFLSNATLPFGLRNINSFADIKIGNGTSPESIDQINLTSQIASGTAIGQLSYGAKAVTTSWSAITRKFTSTVTKTFTNSSGSPVDVTEDGLFCGVATVGTTASLADVILQHEVYGTISVPNSKTLTVSYVFELTYPAA